MKQMLATGLLLALALAGCRQGPDENLAIDESNSLNADVETLPADESSLNNVAAGDAAVPARPPAPGQPAIPAQYYGRWGMAPADCTSTRGDAKGLIGIGGRTIKFYEAIAT